MVEQCVVNRLIILIILGGCVGNSAEFSESSLKALAEKLGSQLFRITKTASGFDEIEKGFAGLKVKVKELDPANSLKDIAKKLSHAVQKKVIAAERLVDFAEESAKSHKWIDNINISYPNAKEPDSHMTGFDLIDFTKDARFFNDAVNLQSSTVHVPTNVFHRSAVTQNGVAWSQKMDNMFRYNFHQDESLKSQYFCSSAGFQRMFPGVRWHFSRDPDKPDMYDCRLANWYIRAASSPKDVIILLDISGSMTGLRRDTAKRMVLEIINTLNEDDFFNVLAFNNNATSLDPCLNSTLVPATEVHKRRFSSLLQNLTTVNFANYTVALPIAFHMLDQNDTLRTTNCNKAIMIVSDNAPSAFEDICLVYNPNRNVRFFTYVIGREVTDYEQMTELACNNRGFVSHIVTMADVRVYVEAYYQVLGRPMVLFKNHSSTWTGAYWHSRNVLGMVVTVAQPVFNRSAAAGSKGSLLGIVGVDLLTEDFIKEMMPHKWGVGSYVFAVNHNGRLIFHPQWKTEMSVARPSHTEADLAHVEIEANKTLNNTFPHFLRDEMIKQNFGTHTMRILRQLDNRKRVYERDYQYYYSGIEGTPFSIGLAVPMTVRFPFNSGKQLEVHGIRKPRETDSNAFDNTHWIVHPNWFYCNATAARFPNMTTFLQDILVKSSLDPELLSLTCDKELLESLMFDVKATSPVGNYWFAENKEQSQLCKLHGITTCFTSTRAGLTRWEEHDFDWDLTSQKNGSQSGAAYSADLAYSDDFANATVPGVVKHYFQVHSKAVDEGWYERTVTIGAELTISVTFPLEKEAEQTSLRSDSFMATIPVFVSQSDDLTAPVAVAGIIMHNGGLTDLIMQISKDTCREGSNCISCHSSATACYLLDESGHIVLDTQYPENSGKFFGILQGEIMESLVEHSVYKKYEIRDHQGVCEMSPKPKKSAGILSHARIGNIFWTLKTFLQLLASYLFLLIGEVFAIETEYYNYEAKDNGTETAAEATHQNPPYLCDADYTLYNSEWNELNLVFQTQCISSCTKNVGIFKVSMTNLLLVALDSPKSCLCNDVRLTTDSGEAQYDEVEICRKYRNLPYRRKPKDCFAYYKDEDFSECGRPEEVSNTASFTNHQTQTLSALIIITVLCCLSLQR